MPCIVSILLINVRLLCFIAARVTSRFLLFRRRSGSTHSARPTHKFSFRLLFRSSQLYHLLAELFYLHVAISLSSSADSRYLYVVISLSRSFLSLSLASRRCVWDPRTCASIAVVSLSLFPSVSPSRKILLFTCSSLSLYFRRFALFLCSYLSL